MQDALRKKEMCILIIRTIDYSKNLTGHLKLKGTLMGALLAMELGSALKMSVSPLPYVHGGSADITSCECLRHTRKKMRQSWESLHTPPWLAYECTFSSNTPDASACETGHGLNKGIKALQRLEGARSSSTQTATQRLYSPAGTLSE